MAHEYKQIMSLHLREKHSLHIMRVSSFTGKLHVTEQDSNTLAWT